MKINVRLLLITFIIVVFISLTSTFIYYSTTTSLLKKQHSNTLINSATDFNFVLQFEVASFDEGLLNILNSSQVSTENSELDFVFQLSESRNIILNTFIHSDKINRSLVTDSFDDFLKQYPNVILKFYQMEDGNSYFYGKIITEEYLNKLSEKVRAEIALIINNVPYIVSNSIQNESYAPNLILALNNQSLNQNSKTDYQELENGDFFSTNYKPDFLINTGEGITFLLFTTPFDLSEFRVTMQMIATTIALTGILLSLVLVLLFTAKLRKQISLLTNASKATAGGDLTNRVQVISNDELGNFGIVFNNMLDHIQLKEESERQYSELVTIINQTPLLKELCDAVLDKIISTTEVSLGLFYVVDNNNAKLISSYGISRSILEVDEKTDLHANVIEKKTNVELTFDENPPIINTGIVEISVRYLLVVPLIFNNNVIGLIELASDNIPENTPVEYLTKIMEQLAVGLNSALSYDQLENLVNELRMLNEVYYKQNLQISEQNSELMELHEELQKQTEELEEQRRKAVELTHVKSQFLANMSHELKTPLNSILGLTELISDDSSTVTKTKERLRIVLRNGKKLLSLINNILEFSKIEAGKFDVQKSNFILSEFILDVYSAMEPLVVEKGLEFEINFNSEFDLLINSDKHKLEQILLNLISNAIKFTDAGKIQIQIDIISSISLQISVVDSGIGITDENKEIIFNEFEQVSLSKKKKHQGAGLGLAICKKYIELIGGTIETESNEFFGTTFSIVLENVILEKFTIDKDFGSLDKNISLEKRTKEILIYGIDEESTEKVASYFDGQNYNTVSSKNLANLMKIGSQASQDGILINISKETEKIWDTIYKLRNDNYTPLKLFSLHGTANNSFALSIFDIITDLEDGTRLNKLIDFVSIYANNVESIFYLGEHSDLLEKSIKKFNNEINFSSNNSINSIEEFIDDVKVDLIISDAVLNKESTLEKLEGISRKKSIPVILHLSELMVKSESSLIHTAFQKIAKQYSSSTDEMIKNIEKEFSLMKKVKKSVTSSIENNISSKKESNSDKEHSLKTWDGDFNVLIVDDDRDTLFTVGEILQNIGCEVTFANNGEECLLALDDNLPDLVLLDIMMPILDGFETIKKIRANTETKNLVVYAITAQAMIDDLDIIKNNGFDDLITKPVNASTLSFKIQQAIQKRAKRS